MRSHTLSRGLLHHAAFEFGTGLRNRAMLLLLYLFPLGFFLIAGALMVGLNPGFRETLIPAMVVFAIMAGCLLGLPDPIVVAREAGIFRSFKIHGVPAANILLLPGAAIVVHLTLVAAIVTVLAPLLFDAPLPARFGAYVGVFLAAAAAHAGLGLLIAVVSASTRATVLWSQLVFLPSVMLGGLMVPSEMIPDTLGTLARLLPATHAMNAMRGLAYGDATAFSPAGSLLVLIAGAILGVALAVRLFQWDRRAEGRRVSPAWGALVLVPYVVGALLL
jgi:ABC-2 type transport system permease protein